MTQDMSSAVLLNQDFGSESEDDNFNPAPAEESDNEAGDDSDDDPNVTQKRKDTQDRQRSSVQQVSDEEEDDTQGRPVNGQQSNAHATQEPKEEDKDTKERDFGGLDEAPDDDEDEEEDQEDEEEDEEEAISGRPRKRARRDPRNQFLDVEAEVDEEDEGDEEEDDNLGDTFIADTHPDDKFDELPEGAERDDRRHRQLDQQRERAAQIDAEEQARLLREKYGRRTATTADAVTVPKRLLLPSVDDPSIWGVKCKPGKEREIVFALMKRIEERAATKNAMPIVSALERKNISGYVYIEAARQADVLTALEGILHLYPRSAITLVPIKEMPDLLRVTKSEQLHAGGYVRIKRGKYANDLAQIDDVETNGLEASLRIVPRLDYGQNEENAPMVDGGIRGEVQKRKRQNAAGLTNPAVRPPPRLFSDVEAKKKHLKYLQQMSTFDKKHWTYQGETYINGFLIKDFKIQHLVTDNVNPTLEEVTRFSSGAEDGTENLDLTALAATLKKGTANENYLPGDMVEVFDGEQQGACGKAISVRGDIVTMSVTDGELRGQSIEVPVKGLRKRFREGDHVKVIGGSRYRDEVGMVVSITADQVTLLSDLSMQEITVFSKDLREASDSGVAGGLGRYDIHDLVQLDPATVGCVTKVDRESLRVLDQNGSNRSIMPSQISNKMERRRNAVATDRNGSEIRTDDTVREIGGEQKQGVILHIYRSFLFLHNREQTDNSGISVVRATNVATVAAKGGRVAQGASNGPDLNKMNPAMMRNGLNGTAMAPPKSFGRDRALGQTVTIRKGAYKGLLGIVKDTTDQEARVELHTKGKTITVPKDTLGFKDSLTGQNIDYARFAGSRGRGNGGRGGFGGDMGGATPGRDWSGGRTPLPVGGGRTPAWGAGGGGRTPAYAGNASSKTPMWRQDASGGGGGGGGGGRTPAYTTSGDGSRTVNPYNDGNRTVNPYGGSTSYGGPSATGGRTPAWNQPATASSYSQDPFAGSNAGGRTPAYEPSYSRTPGPSYNPPASSNRPYDAPTPGKDFATAPTPTAHPANGYGNVGNTPAAMGGAPTPKFSGDAPTPFGQPETPGWGGSGEGDDAPRYEEGTPSP